MLSSLTKPNDSAPQRSMGMTDAGQRLLRYATMDVFKDTDDKYIASYIKVFYANCNNLEFIKEVSTVPSFFYNFIGRIKSPILRKEAEITLLDMILETNERKSDIKLYEIINEITRHDSTSNGNNEIYRFFEACTDKTKAMLFFDHQDYDDKNAVQRYLNEIHDLRLTNDGNRDFFECYASHSIIYSFLKEKGYDTLQYTNDFYDSKKKNVVVETPSNEVILIDEENLKVYSDSFGKKITDLVIDRMFRPEIETSLEEEILYVLQEFTDKLFFQRDRNELKKVINDLKKHPIEVVDLIENDYKLYVLPLSAYIEKGVGVCRHRALLDAYLLDSLVKKGILKGHLEVKQAIVSSTTGHLFTILRQQTSSKVNPSIVYFIDTLNNITKVIDKETIETCVQLGFKLMLNILNEPVPVLEEPVLPAPPPAVLMAAATTNRKEKTASPLSQPLIAAQPSISEPLSRPAARPA